MSVRIRPLQHEDLRYYYRWQEEEPHWEYYTCRPVQFIRPFSVFLSRYWQEAETGRQVVYTVEEDDAVVGRMVAFDFNARNRSIEIGYYLCAEARGHGVGRSALGLWVDTLFRWPGRSLHKLYATTSSDNAASAAILERCGFRLDGALREHYLSDGQWSDQLFYSLLRGEWEAAAADAPRL